MKKTIYTVNLNGYDSFKEPLIVTPNWNYEYITDNRDFKSDIWNISYIEKTDVKQARRMKIISPYKDDDIYIWIDSSIQINCNLDDFINTAEGFRDALDRWKKRGCPGTGNRHIELCRKNVAIADDSDTIQINLNKNLYNEHSGEIFSKGADFTEQQYIHLKIRDYRIELSLEDFKELSHAVKEATNRLENSSIHVAL